MNPQKTILIVDDSASIRAQVKTVLERDGYVVREATSESGMFMSLLEYGVKVDLILMDLVLRSDNGLDLIANLRSHESFKKIPILILTEHADKNYVQRARVLQVDGYVLKPLDMPLLKQRIHQILMEKETENTAKA